MTQPTQRALCLFISLAVAACTGGKLPTPRATEVGTPTGTLSEKTLGAAGGSLVSADGLLTLDVPAGALAADTKLGLQPLTSTAPNGLGAGFRLSPEGTTFASPVKLTFKPSAAQLAGTVLALTGVATQDASHVWRWVHGVTRDEANGQVSVTTTHFSDWSLVAGAQLRPPSASVETGKTLGLTAIDCFSVESDDQLAPLFDCAQTELAPQPMSLSNWAVNGTAGGSSTVGTVSAQGVAATYQAPATKPNPSTVAVSVDAANVKIDGQTFAKATLLANVTIGSVTKYTGTFTLSWQEVAAGTTTSFTASGTAEFGHPNTTSTGMSFSITGSASSAQVADFHFSTADVTCTAATGTAGFGSTTLLLHTAPSEHAVTLAVSGSTTAHCVPTGMPAYDSTKVFTGAVGTGNAGDCTGPKFVPSAADGKNLTGNASWQCTLAAGHTITATLDWALTGS